MKAVDWRGERAMELRHTFSSSDFRLARFAPQLFRLFLHYGAWSKATPTQFSFLSRGLAGLAAGLVIIVVNVIFF